MHRIITQELGNLAFHILLRFKIITKSRAMGRTAINHEQMWADQEFGLLIFSWEGFYAGTNPIMFALLEIGAHPTVSYSGKIILQPDQ